MTGQKKRNMGKALKYAVRIDLLVANPAEKVVLPRMQGYVASYYNEKELTILFEKVKGTPLELGVFLASYYGLRRSEIVGLKWDAVDFERKTITIKHTVMNVNDNGKVRLVQKDRNKVGRKILCKRFSTKSRNVANMDRSINIST